MIRDNTKQTTLWTRIESTAGPGVPDAHALSDGVSVWAELKVARGNRVLLSKFQVAWALRYRRFGGVSWIIVYPVTKRPPEYFSAPSKKPPILIYQGSMAQELMEKGIALRPHAMIDYPYDWSAFSATLFSAPSADSGT